MPKVQWFVELAILSIVRLDCPPLFPKMARDYESDINHVAQCCDFCRNN